jgi:hypothetical protein
MAYTKQTWHDFPLTDTPILAARLDHMEQGIFDASSSLISSSGAVLVASADAPTAVKAVADYVCDGTADQVEIQNAVNDAAALFSRNSTAPASAKQRGKVQLTGGRFNFSAGVSMHTGVWVGGMGYLTECRAVGNNSPGMFQLATPKAHLCTVSDMYLEGNASSGGSCDAIDFDMTDSSPSTSTYPDTNPDGDHHIYNLWIHQFSGTSTRNAINFSATGSHNSRGHLVHDCQIRICTGTAVRMAGASDSFVHAVHVGGADDIGFDIASGNIRITNCKAYFVDNIAFNFTGSRVTASNLEMQDSATGFVLNSSNGNYANLSADTFSADGIRFASGGQVLTGAQVYMRGGGRYATGARGYVLGSGLAGIMCYGRIDPANITTAISGTAHATQSAGRILNGGAPFQFAT